jgi:hypothetical protein
MWACRTCKRTFTRANQRHACGTGDPREVVRDRPKAIVDLYASIASFARALGPVELVTRDRYVLLRSVRLFADLVIMARAVRVAVYLGRRVDSPVFLKIAVGPRFVIHVAKVETGKQLALVTPFLKEAYEFSLPRG